MRYRILIAVAFFTLLSFGQEDNSYVDKTTVSASFPGGTDSLYKFIAQTTRVPNRALENAIDGQVTLTFTIDTFGNLYDINLLKLEYCPNYNRFTSK